MDADQVPAPQKMDRVLFLPRKKWTGSTESHLNLPRNMNCMIRAPPDWTGSGPDSAPDQISWSKRKFSKRSIVSSYFRPVATCYFIHTQQILCSFNLDVIVAPLNHHIKFRAVASWFGVSCPCDQSVNYVQPRLHSEFLANFRNLPVSFVQFHSSPGSLGLFSKISNGSFCGATWKQSKY
jgi:hypothetical protein